MSVVNQGAFRSNSRVTDSSSYSIRPPKTRAMIRSQYAGADPLEELQDWSAEEYYLDADGQEVQQVVTRESRRQEAVIIPQKNSKNWGVMLRGALVVAVLLVVCTVYLVREERVASVTADIYKINREIDSLNVTYDAKRTQFECSTDLDAIRQTASERLRMGDWNEDQVNVIDYDDPSLMAVDYLAQSASLVQSTINVEAAAASSITEEQASTTQQSQLTEKETTAEVNVSEMPTVSIPIESASAE